MRMVSFRREDWKPLMTLTAELVDDGVYTVADVVSPDECLELIERAERIGFQAASVKTHGGQKMLTHIRNNDRVNLEDRELADGMWTRSLLRICVSIF